MTGLQKQIVSVIFKAIKKFKANNIDIAKGLQLSEHLLPEIEKLMYSACQRQKEICSKQVNGYAVSRDVESQIETDVLDAPLPSEVERCYSGKEVSEIATKAWIANMVDQTDERSYLSVESLLKEYGIKI